MQVMWLGHKNQIDKINIRSVPVLSSTVSIVESARDLSVVIDNRLTMSDQRRASYYQLRQSSGGSITARGICQNTSPVFISCRLHYCNVLLYGISDSRLSICTRSRMQRHAFWRE